MRSIFDVYTEQTWKIITIINVVVSSISLVTSTIMALFVSRPKAGGLKTPYRRIIFGMSISDIFQSIAFTLGPWAVPQSAVNQDSFGIGNNITCNLDGISMTIGSTAMQYYVCLLCFFFLCKLKWRMSDEEFTRKYEFKAHILIFLFVINCSIMGIYWGAYNPVIFHNICFFATKPWGCRVFDDPDVGECEEPLTTHVDTLTFIVVVITFIFNAIGISVIMIQLACHANESTKNIVNDVTITPDSRNSNQEERVVDGGHGHEGSTSTRERRADIEGEGEIQESNSDSDSQQPRNDHSSQMLHDIAVSFRREVTKQAALWVGVYALTTVSIFFAVVIIYFMAIENVMTDVILIAVALSLFSSAGIFNILVYTRPKVSVLRKRCPGLSRIRALWMVLKAGGELPLMDFDPEPEEEQHRMRDYGENLVVRPRNEAQLDGVSGTAADDVQGNINDRTNQNWSHVIGGRSTYGDSLAHLNEANLRDFGLSFSRNEYHGESRVEAFNDMSGVSEDSVVRMKGMSFWNNMVQSFKSSLSASS